MKGVGFGVEEFRVKGLGVGGADNPLVGTAPHQLSFQVLTGLGVLTITLDQVPFRVECENPTSGLASSAPIPG